MLISGGSGLADRLKDRLGCATCPQRSYGMYEGLGSGGDINPPTLSLDQPWGPPSGTTLATADILKSFSGGGGKSFFDMDFNAGDVVSGVGSAVAGALPALVGLFGGLLGGKTQTKIASTQAKSQGALVAAQERMNQARIDAGLELERLKQAGASAQTAAQAEALKIQQQVFNQKSQNEQAALAAQVRMAQANAAAAAAGKPLPFPTWPLWAVPVGLGLAGLTYWVVKKK